MLSPVPTEMEDIHALLLRLVFAISCLKCTWTLENDPCRLPSGLQGTCREISLCPSVLETFRETRPVHCGFKGRTPIVCCPKEDVKTSPVIDISAPDLDFECGIRFVQPLVIPSSEVTERRRRRSIVGGTISERNTWPWMALLGERLVSEATIDWLCAGSLINRQWVLTAAHCFDRSSPNVVRLGEHDYADPADQAFHEDFDVAEYIVHPDYTFPQAYHDIALIRLDRNVSISRFIRPVCLSWGPQSVPNLVGLSITATGWGATSHGDVGSTVLQEVVVSVFPPSRCDSLYSELVNYPRIWPQGIGETIMCAGEVEGGKDACQGDSGGPAVYADKDDLYYIVGVISQGYGCGNKNFPGLYTNALRPEYLAWIKRVAF